jgi:phage major head subunit gpT-like protein
MDITFPALQSINIGVTTAYNTQFEAAESIYKIFTDEQNSSSAAEIYPRLDMIPGMREWVGERVQHSLSLQTFTITNKMFENTIVISRTNIEDDQFGFLKTAAAQMGQTAGRLPDVLVAGLLTNGHSTIGIDGQNFFDTAHPNFTTTGANTTQPNYQAGSGNPSWYLVDNSQVVKPFIYQKRRPFVLTPKISLTDENVFNRAEFIWGVDGRCNAGYGLWQMAYRSDAPMTLANLNLARTTMAAWRRPDGAPMGINPTHLIAPVSLTPLGKAYCENDYDPLGTSGLTPNTFKGMAKYVENRWIY